MNPWYNRVTENIPSVQTSSLNPIQRFQYMAQALANPVAFVRQQFPDVPEELLTDPNRVLQYLQQTRGISNDQINQIVNQMPRR